jgi:hypothetical protein
MYRLPCSSGILNLLEPSGPVQASKGITLRLLCFYISVYIVYSCSETQHNRPRLLLMHMTLLLWWIPPSVSLIPVPETEQASLFTTVCLPSCVPVCRLLSFHHFPDVGALHLERTIQRTSTCLCLEMAEIWRSSCNKLTERQVHGYRQSQEKVFV